MKIDYELKKRCEGAMLDLMYSNSPYMPVLTGKLLERFLEKLDKFEEESLQSGKNIIIQ